MSTGVFSETIIASGVVSPISMTTFPAVETFQPVWPGNQPDIASSQVEILVPDQTDVFDAIPSVCLWNHDRFNHHGWGNHHCRLKRNRRQV